jgi:hypothetical protein
MTKNRHPDRLRALASRQRDRFNKAWASGDSREVLHASVASALIDAVERQTRTIVDASHQSHVRVFDYVLEIVTLDRWLGENEEVSRTQVTDYRAGNILGRISQEKRNTIEQAIRRSAEKYGILGPPFEFIEAGRVSPSRSEG